MTSNAAGDEPEIQVYLFRGKRIVLRAKPTGPPTPAQIAARRLFGETAKQAAGLRRENGLPPAATLVRQKMSGRLFAGTRPPPRWKLVLLAYLIAQGHSDEFALAIVNALPD